jgi:hypothetical protein
MPSEETNHQKGDNEIEDRVSGRQASFDKEREGDDLQGIGGDGDAPGQAKLGVFDRIKVMLEVIEE